MFQRGTEVGCCAIMHEERKRGSKAASSKGNKQRQTGVCLPEAPLNLSGRRTNRHPHTPTSITHSRSKWWPGCYADKTHTHTHALSIVCVLFCAHASVCAKVPTRLVMVQNKPVSAPAGHKETGGEHGKKVGWMERRGKNGGRMKEQDYTAVDCHLWRPATVWAEEFVSLWWCYRVYFSSLSSSSSSSSSSSLSSALRFLQVPHFPSV